MKIDFAGKSVIVTGAGHGLGRAIAHAFSARGAVVWACDVNGSTLEVTKSEAEGDCRARIVDITDRAALNNLAREVEEEQKKTDILVNCAGGVAGQAGKPLEEVTAKEWQEIFDINVTGAFNIIQAVTPAMKAARSGRIVNISSRAGISVSLTGIQAYAAAKAALIGLTRQLAHEFGPYNINVNSIAPGFIRSNPTTEKQWEAFGADGQKDLIEAIALKRLGTPEDIAHAVLFFSSDYANWITGQTLSVDGG